MANDNFVVVALLYIAVSGGELSSGLMWKDLFGRSGHVLDFPEGNVAVLWHFSVTVAPPDDKKFENA